MYTKVFVALAILWGGPSPALADATIPTKDIPGSADRAALPRYEGSFIVSFEHQDYTDFTLPLSALEKQDKTDAINNNVYTPKDAKKLEGSLTRLVYLEPAKRSPLEVLRNYQDAIQKAGGKLLFECKGEDCGGSSRRAAAGGGGDQSLTMQFVTEKTLKDPQFSNGYCALASGITDQRYFSASFPQDGGDAYVAVQTYSITDGGAYCGLFSQRTIAVVHLLEPKGRDKKMVVVTAEDMATSIAATGKVALYNIYFATDKADLTADSDPSLQEIANLLTSSKDLKAVIVGHTDSVGGYDYNVDLSKRRAASVTDALIRRYHIAADRLKSAGVGMVSPVASNASEDGRAKNRRVEVVRLN